MSDTTFKMACFALHAFAISFLIAILVLCYLLFRIHTDMKNINTDDAYICFSLEEEDVRQPEELASL